MPGNIKSTKSCSLKCQFDIKGPGWEARKWGYNIAFGEHGVATFASDTMECDENMSEAVFTNSSLCGECYEVFVSGEDCPSIVAAGDKHRWRNLEPPRVKEEALSVRKSKYQIENVLIITAASRHN